MDSPPHGAARDRTGRGTLPVPRPAGSFKYPAADALAIVVRRGETFEGVQGAVRRGEHESGKAAADST